MDAANPTAQAVAIREGKFVRVGTNDQARALVGAGTRILDAHGQSVIPGLFETHVHAVGVARDQAGEPFRQLSSLADIERWVVEKAARTPAGEWIKILRVDLTRFEEGRFPTRAELDDMLRDRPLVFDWSYAGINQVQVLNTAALAAAGIGRSTPDPEGGRIVRDAAGNPTGVIRNARSLIVEKRRMTPRAVENHSNPSLFGARSPAVVYLVRGAHASACSARRPAGQCAGRDARHSLRDAGAPRARASPRCPETGMRPLHAIALTAA